MSHGGRRLRITAKAVGRPPDPKVTCAADLSRQPAAGFDERGVETEHGEAFEAPATERAGNR